MNIENGNIWDFAQRFAVELVPARVHKFGFIL
jgi:hypothetical protein